MLSSTPPVSDGDVVELQDTKHQTTVSIVPSVGNIAFEMKVKGHNVLRWPYASVEEFKARPAMQGIPFMGPWANRLDEQAFYANGKRYAFDMELGNVRGRDSDPRLPDDDRPVAGGRRQGRRPVGAGRRAGSSSIGNPTWMKQFPFAHTIDMTYTLQDGVLEVATTIENLSAEPMPVSVGLSPVLSADRFASRRVDDVGCARRRSGCWRRTRCRPARRSRSRRYCRIRKRPSLKDYDLDHVFGDLVRDASGRAVMTVKGKSQQLDVVVGPNYRAIVVYAPKPQPAGHAEPCAPPQNRNFICFEPMAGDHERDEPRAQGTLQGAAEHRARRNLAGELLGAAARLLSGAAAFRPAPGALRNIPAILNVIL